MNNFDNKVSQRDGKQVLKEDSKEVEDLCAIIGLLLATEISDNPPWTSFYFGHIESCPTRDDRG